MLRNIDDMLRNINEHIMGYLETELMETDLDEIEYELKRSPYQWNEILDDTMLTTQVVFSIIKCIGCKYMDAGTMATDYILYVIEQNRARLVDIQPATFEEPWYKARDRLDWSIYTYGEKKLMLSRITLSEEWDGITDV